MRLIVAMDVNRAIGKNGALPWVLKDDLKRFKELTTGNTIVMGRKTYESIGRPLPNRTNIVISRDKSLQIEGCHVVSSVKEAMLIDMDPFVIGGEEIYKMFLPLVDKIYLTTVHTRIKDADSFFPELDLDEWNISDYDYHFKNDRNEFDYTNMILTLAK
jgi:dihydrofolate reductase